MKVFVFIIFTLGCITVINAQNTPTAKTTLKHIKELTTESHNLCDMVKNINLFNLFIDGPRVANSMTTDIIPAALSLAMAFTSAQAPFDNMDGDILVRELVIFSKAFKELLDALLGRFGILSSFNFAESVKLSLIVLNLIINEISKHAIQMTPTRGSVLRIEFLDLNKACKGAISKYSTSWPRASYRGSSTAYVEEYNAKEYDTEVEVATSEYYQSVSEYYEKPDSEKQHIRGSDLYRGLST